MGGVLGVSVGSGFVRIVRRRSADAHAAAEVLERRTLVVDDHNPESLAAESIGVLLAGDEEAGSLPSVGIAYTDESQAAAVDAALRREGIADCQLIPELSALLEHLGATRALAGLAAVVVIDLGRSGTTVSVVDVATGSVHAAERTTADAAGLEEAVDLADELLTQSGRGADAVVLVGGGAHAEGIRERVADLAGLPVVVPDDPELAAASGAALLGSGMRAAATPSHRPEVHRPKAHRRGSRGNVSRRQVRSAGAAGVMLALLAVIGFGLGYGRTLFGSAPDESAGRPVTSSVTAASVPPAIPPSTSSVIPMPPPASDLAEAPRTGSAARPVANGADLPASPTRPVPAVPDSLDAVLDALTGLPLPQLPPLESLPLPQVPQIPRF
ncbi:hypothetical protein ACFTSD_19240 [Nocardiaceae bacterium NPDC056970]